ncbi:FG-GAP repeat domain-containing protein [Pelagovum pacificum]|uniref:VCBS repeat-containing protein n=1 Tax=Pelagovum pacificum TaxID=2588711 RepID=A0A5C5GDU6_9RHOB|nr:VCBS repeat-containing protein [Pelagovum pacificum]QQA44003.1 VCBS repeat-containing protein [Pelagovum pacificum]TNY32868.1 VCBS repeat-containing protein [Pelagovum pacificum]
MRAAPIAGLAMLLALPVEAQVPDILSAHYDGPTDRYPHGALGDPFEWGTLVLERNQCPGCAGIERDTLTINLPPELVFEDTAPRLVDVDGDGLRDVITVQSHRDYGARLAVFDSLGAVVAATDRIGQPNRWLAPLGAVDLDGDGRVEIAYVDRPHLAKRLIVVEYREGTLTPEAVAEGHTNHRFGDPEIGGGLRLCDGAAEIITASGDWTRVLATSLRNGVLSSRDLGPYTGPDSFTAALAC